MPRATPPTLVESIRTLAAEGVSQPAIARQLGIKQPRVSKVMQAHNIVRVKRKPPLTSDGPIRIAVQVWLGSKCARTILNATPEQLRETATAVEEMMQPRELVTRNPA